MKNHNEILSSINETINNSHYSYPQYREKIGDPIRPVEREFINGPKEDLDGNKTDSSNHVIDSTTASAGRGAIIRDELNRGLLSYKPNQKFSEGEDLTDEDIDLIKNRSKWTNLVAKASEQELADLGEAASEFNPYATINNLAYGENNGNSFQIGNNLHGGVE